MIRKNPACKVLAGFFKSNNYIKNEIVILFNFVHFFSF